MDNYKSLASTIRDMGKTVPMLSDVEWRYSRICSTIRNMYEKKKIEKDQNDQIGVGSYMTKHFEMNPKAQLLYTDLPKDTNPSAAENSAINHDKLFAMEKEVVAKGEATPEEAKRASELVDLIHHFAKQMNLEKEHSYLNNNLQRIQSLVKNDSNEISPNDVEATIAKRFKSPPARSTPEPKDMDIDSSKFLIRRDMKGQRKLKIIDGD